MTKCTVAFSESETALVTEHYPDIDKIMEMTPGKTRSDIRIKACELGLAPFSSLRWTMEEDSKIRKHYPDTARLQIMLRDRTVKAITTRAWALGIAKPQKRWTPERKEVLARIGGRITDHLASEIVGGTVRSITRQRAIMGLPVLRVRRPSKVPLIQDIFDAATARKIRLGKITKALGCPTIKPCLTDLSMSVVSVLKVVEALGGELYAEWED